MTLANYDPQRSEQQRVIHSSSATVHMMQIGFEHGLLTDDNTDFHFAVDDIVTESTLDASGRWSITLDVAAMCYKVWAAACAEITSWVLCYEPVSHPSSPATIYLPDPEMVKAQVALVEARHNRVARMINEGSIEAAVSRVAETISGYRQYARMPGADVMRAGRDLAELATLMAKPARRNAEAVDALQALLEVYGAFTPQDADRLDYHISFAEARHNLMARFIDGGRVEHALDMLTDTIAGYRQYARMPGADVMRAGRDLAELATLMAKPARRNAEAVDALQALLEVYGAFTPQDADRLDYHISFAEARHNLIARLIDEGRTEEAASLVAETIAGYKEYAYLAGADGMRASRNLAELASLMARAGRSTAAEAAQEASEAMHNDFD
ncbi:hypothetical protein [Streptomyces galilaeus]|uniref:hypothetical protein n=1 Tax=Streptomyces galilaeus TaxID=33899 RepID=UPI0038F72C65